jgi:hypothetical protein
MKYLYYCSLFIFGEASESFSAFCFLALGLSNFISRGLAPIVCSRTIPAFPVRHNAEGAIPNFSNHNADDKETERVHIGMDPVIRLHH